MLRKMSRPGSQDAPLESQFLQCRNCKKVLFLAEFEADLRVCPNCGHHHRLPASRRIEVTFDPGSFQEHDAELRSVDPLSFPDYMPKYEDAVRKTGLNDAVVTGMAQLGGKRVSAAVLDFHFMGGSMGSVGGEKICRTFERGIENRAPILAFCASGGARMQEGLLSLMQIAKTTAAVEKAREARVPFLAIFTDPTMAGVLASYASIADVILAEPRAMVGFAGTRVSKQAQVVKMPDDFQTSEFFLSHGLIDRVVERRDLRATLTSLVKMLGAHLESQS